jgi:MoaA/NifB/PqqE/SkfB family radical SAM enzyme
MATDLFRGASLDPADVERAFAWLDGRASYPKPLSIHWDLTFRCTARCRHCLQWTWPKQEELTLPDAEGVLATFREWGVKTLTFGGGNPLLRHDIAQIVASARSGGFAVGIISEGVDLPADLANQIVPHLAWIRFSLDGPTATVHDQLRNAPGLFDRVGKAILTLREQSATLPIGLNCVIQRGNMARLPEMIALAERLGVDAIMFKLAHGDDPRHVYLPTRAEWDEVIAWLRLASAQTYKTKTNLRDLTAMIARMCDSADMADGVPVRSHYRREQIRCFAPLFFLVCNSHGDIYPCDYLQADTRAWQGTAGQMRREFVLGNVVSDPAAVLDRLEAQMRARIHDLPASGYKECGCCTRFCELNTELHALRTTGVPPRSAPSAESSFL